MSAVTLEDISRRIGSLEERMNKTDVERAREDADRKHMDARFDALESRIDGAIRWFMGTVGSAILLAVVGFVLKGGLLN